MLYIMCVEHFVYILTRKDTWNLKKTLTDKSSIYRALIMSLNDGVISISAVVMGLLAKHTNIYLILITGALTTFAGMVSMAIGELESMSSESDMQRSLIEKEKVNLLNHRKEVLEYLSNKFQAKGIAKELSNDISKDLIKEDALRTLVQEKYGFDIEDLSKPIDAAVASFIAFPIGAILPIVTTLIPVSYNVKPLLIFVIVLLVLILTGVLSSQLTHSSCVKSIKRNVIAGSFAMIVTYAALLF